MQYFLYFLQFENIFLEIDILKVILNSIDSQTKENIFTGIYTDRWLVKQRNGQ